MTDYLKIREAFFNCKLDLYELEALKGLVDAEIRDEEKQIKLWTIEGKYRSDLRDQFLVIRLALEDQNYKLSVDRPTHCENCCIKWCLRKPGECYSDLQLRTDGTWKIIGRSVSIPSEAKHSLVELLARRQVNVTGWKIAS